MKSLKSITCLSCQQVDDILIIIELNQFLKLSSYDINYKDLYSVSDW